MPRPYHRTKPTRPRYGSVNDYLSRLNVGDCHYFERDDQHALMSIRRCIAAGRLPDTMRGMKFSTSTCTAVFNGGRVKYLLRAERVT